MNIENVLNEVEYGKFQPHFELTNSLIDAVDDLLKPHEDYFLNLHDKVEEIIDREVNYFKTLDEITITFNDIISWQHELLKHKFERFNYLLKFTEDKELKHNLLNLPNLHINIGLRTTDVKVGNFTPPSNITLPNLIGMCFPIKLTHEQFILGEDINGECHNFIVSSNGIKNDVRNNFVNVIDTLRRWYKMFSVIHPLQDLNGRISGIILNILSKLITGKYIKKMNTKIRVNDYKEFAFFNYETDPNINSYFNLGDVVINIDTYEIGVILQMHDDVEFRTDMYGNTSNTDSRHATLEEIKKYRPQILEYLKNE